MPKERASIVASPDQANDPNVFPLLRGFAFPKKTVEWSTTTLRSKSGRVFAKQNYSYPIRRWAISFSSLSQAADRRDLDRIEAFHAFRAGANGTFNFYDPDDNLVDGQSIGVGNGVTTQFQLKRSFSNWSEPIFALNGAPTIKVGGVQVTNINYATPGVIRFAVAPGAGQIVTWSGSFLFICRFTQDDLTVEQINDHLFSGDGLEFETVKI